MAKTVVDMLRIALDGRAAHSLSFKILDGLDHSMATKAQKGDLFTSWELLWHLIFWQDLTIKAIEGEQVDWKWATKNDWPLSELQGKAPWEVLVLRFKEGVSKMQEMVMNADIDRPLATWGDAPTAQPFIVIAQHNSYHLGQIVMNRKAQGTWPPPEKS